MARTVALDRGPAALRRDPDPVIVRGVCLGAASHQSYPHTHAYLSFCARAMYFFAAAFCARLQTQSPSLKRFDYAEAIFRSHFPQNPMDVVLHGLFGEV